MKHNMTNTKIVQYITVSFMSAHYKIQNHIIMNKNLPPSLPFFLVSAVFMPLSVFFFYLINY